MIKINLQIEDSSTRLDDIKEPDLKVKASALTTKLEAIISPLSCPVCGKDGTVEVTLVFDKFVQARIHPDHICHREFSTIIYRALPPLLKELSQQ
jgi:hypothetical protein